MESLFAMATQAKIFDLTPHPRILPMLGQIPLAQWKCLAELLDNCIDAFIEAGRIGQVIHNPHVVITTPLNSVASGQITVRDNGPGMDPTTLERAAKAGWSGRDPINNLGLFGMGFNIATARLCSKTTVWTTRSGDLEWTGLEIDFDNLTRHSNFLTTALHRPKADASESGTEIVLERLKQEMREWFAKGANRTQITRNLGRTYSAILGAGGTPTNFRLEFNGNVVRARPHCIWGGPGNPERSVVHPTLGTINAYQDFDFQFSSRKFCTSCWTWLGAGESECPQCGSEGTVVDRTRRVRGWIGLQRYQHETDYGIDLLRNGRKIELGCKDLFAWRDPNTDEEIIEYPIDDQRHRGRIVGEIHLDHCQVPYTKERFLREDAAWTEMLSLVRGTGPLQPRIAESRGLGGNTSPLYKLYQAYRRSSPQGRAASWAKLLVVRDDERAQEMARRFDNGEPEYQSDAKWFELAEEEDEKVLNAGRSAGGGLTLGGGGTALGGGSTSPAGPSGGTSPGGALTGTAARARGGQLGGGPIPAAIARQPIHDLTREYRDDLTGQLFNVRAFYAAPIDPDVGSEPWSARKTSTGDWDFIVNPNHSAFSSATLTPLDALLIHLAHHAADLEQSQNAPHKFPAILASFRSKFASRYKLDTADLARKAANAIRQMAMAAAGQVTFETLESFFSNECSPTMQENIRSAMARKAAPNPQQAIQDGRYLQYAPPQVVVDFFLGHPEEFFDGAFWDEPYANLHYGSSAADDEARKRVLAYYSSLLSDAVWLSQLEDGTETPATRERLLRASLAADLLAPIVDIG
jgi:hypothetical protein